MRIMNGDESKSLVDECVRGLKVSYYLNPTRYVRIWILSDGLCIVVVHKSTETEYIIGPPRKCLSVPHDTAYHDELSRSNLHYYIKTFLLFSILK